RGARTSRARVARLRACARPAAGRRPPARRRPSFATWTSRLAPWLRGFWPHLTSGQGLARIGELVELANGKPPSEMLPDAAQVEGAGPAKPGVAGRRQDRPCPAAVSRAVSALDQPGPNQPVDQPRDPTAAQPNPLREFGHP